MILNDTKFFILINIFFSVIIFYFGNTIYNDILNQIYIFLVPLIWPGLAHGSLDILTAKRKQVIKSSLSFFIFLILYLLIPTMFFLLWKFFPDYIFTIFLLLSLMHFGISDKLSKKKIMVLNEIFLRSLIIICLPIVFYNEQTLNIFYYLNITYIYGVFLTNICEVLIYFIIPLLILFFSFTLKKKEFGHIIDIILLIFCFIFFEPILSFLIYFCFLHSVRHLLNEKNYLIYQLKIYLLKQYQ